MQYKQHPHITPRGLSEIEAARYIGMSRSFLAQARMEGLRATRTQAPPFIKIGRSVRYLREDLDIWLDSLYKQDHNGQAV